MVCASFANPTIYSPFRCRRVWAAALFTSWKQPASLRSSPDWKNVRKNFGPSSGMKNGGRAFGGNLGGNSGSNANPGFSGELFASTPELDRLATKSSDAPILVRVVSYNILSPALTSPDRYRHCNPDDLNAAVRLKRVLEKLDEPVASRSVICLQEIALTWSGPLHAFFATRGYHLVLGSYGSYFNGYMGVALAFPTDLYESLEIHVERVADMVEWPDEQPKNPIQKFAENIRHSILDFISALAGKSPRERRTWNNPWTQSKNRRNIMIFARLRSKTNGARFCVGTYHMPCAYWSPPIMLIHSALVVSQFQALCKSDPAVLAGDFNIKPGDSAYDMITCGTIDANHVDFPPKAPDGSPATKWFPTGFTPMKSAYKEVNGREPDFTNYAQVEDTPPFIETLDYLFCTAALDVVDVMRLPDRKVVNGPFPVSNEPSDHLMIGATFRLPAENASKAGVSSRLSNFVSSSTQSLNSKQYESRRR